MVPDPGRRPLTSQPHLSHIYQQDSDYLTFAEESSSSLDKGKQPVSRQRSFVSEHGHDADDERSTPSTSSERSSFDTIMVLGISGQAPDPSYPGEDTRSTSRKELLGFYTYSFAAEVFVVCGLGAFIPITLEDLARASSTAVLAHDHTQSCRAHGIDRRDLLDPSLLFSRADHEKAKGAQCVFQFLGLEVNTASFAMYTFSLSVLIQALVVVTMSGAADHGRFRKSLMITFAVIGAIATMLFLPVTPSVYLLGSLWAIIGNVCFGASFVLLNSFLPLLVRWYPSVRPVTRHQDNGEVWGDEHEYNEEQYQHPVGASDILDSTASLLPTDGHTEPFPASRSLPSVEMQLSTKISSYGIGIGYLAAVIVQILSVFILKAMGGDLFSLRLVLFMIGSWWLCFTIPAAYLMRPRPGPPISEEASGRSWSGYITYSWQNLYRTILRARRLKDVVLFLAAWFMISDAVATVSGTAILFAKTTLGMQSTALAMINVIVTISGIFGAFTWSKVSRMMQLKPSQTILTCICLFELIPLYGLLGYIPAIQRYGSFGLQQQWEMYPLGAVYGLVLGGLSSYCRSLYGELIPPGSEAAFYALYAITDKGSSVFGPAIVGAITDATGDIRPAFWFLAVLIGLPIPLMFMVNVERGKREGLKLARETLPTVSAALDEPCIDSRSVDEYESRVHR
ncbi:Putative MFS transporter superfamily [Septoria linicola]|uniref:Autophagy-related protein n=1 Tax=Septoria linicola TaxID=215465 RepID=A0A9Q9AZL2_9PEZI|nr:putative MFS transporter superfamily [Septoria linicola]USW58927.1 Putative MFS transporter superfamily [Septoria linicola]